MAIPVDNVSSSQISEAAPSAELLWFCGSGEDADPLLLVPCSFKILYQIQIKRNDPCLPLHFEDDSNGWEGQWGVGKGKSLAKWKVLR